MWESLIGVLIGGSITLIANYLNNIREDKRLEKKLEHENKKQLRKYKLNRLYKQ